jgi:hypothetical protein
MRGWHFSLWQVVPFPLLQWFLVPAAHPLWTRRHFALPSGAIFAGPISANVMVFGSSSASCFLVAWTFHIAFCHFSRYHFSKCHGFFGFQKRILVLGCVGASPCFLSIVGTILANAMVYGSSRSASSLDAWRFAPLSAIFVGSMVFGSSGASFWTRQHLALLSAILAELLRWVFLPAQ